MKLLKKVKTIEPKRCFVLSQRFTSKDIKVESIRKCMIKVDSKTFEKDIEEEKRKILKLSEKELDKIIADDDGIRLPAYNKMNWYMGYVDIDEVGSWCGAGSIPNSWTKKSLKFTADKVAEEIDNDKSKLKEKRAIKVIPKIIKVKNIIKKEKYFSPIVLPGGTVVECREGMNRMVADIDDGNMRALAFAIGGAKKIKAYIGVEV